MTKTGKVGTFGGMQIPTVTIFMDGFYYGVQYYNEEARHSVKVLGWDPATQTGSVHRQLRDPTKTAAPWA